MSKGKATPKMVSYMTNLGKSRQVEGGMSGEEVEEMVALWASMDLLTYDFVSLKINEYKTMPKRTDFAPPKVEPGYYKKKVEGEEHYYVVVKTKDGQRTYAKELLYLSGRWQWVYTKGAVSMLTGMIPLSLEEASSWGHLHGICMICCRFLRDPESVKRGVGPTCAKSLKRVSTIESK